MTAMNRCLQSLSRRSVLLLLAAVSCLSAVGCGGGSDAPSTAPDAVVVRWDQPEYTIAPPAGSSGSTSAVVTVSGSNLPDIVGVNLSPSGTGTGLPTLGSSVLFMNKFGQVPILITAPSSSPKGRYPLEATVIIGGINYSGKATLIVQ